MKETMRDPSMRWLVGIGVAVLVLLIVGVAVALATRGRAETLYPGDVPEGVVQRFLKAVEAEDYQEAYGYLASEVQEECTQEFFSDRVLGASIEEIQVTLEETRTFDGQARVTVNVERFRASGPVFMEPYSYSHRPTFRLKREDGQWRFSEVPWPIDRCPRPEPPKPPVS